MESYILYRKIMELEKNKEHIFRIPTLFNPFSSEFVLEVSETQFKNNMIVELTLNSTQAISGAKPVSLFVKLENLITIFSAKDYESIVNRDYLLSGCKSNQALQLALSIKRLDNVI
jgi:hypothetical protein